MGHLSSHNSNKGPDKGIFLPGVQSWNQDRHQLGPAGRQGGGITGSELKRAVPKEIELRRAVPKEMVRGFHQRFQII